MNYFPIALICVIPSAWVNAEAQWRIGAGWGVIASVISFAFLAALFTLASANGFRRWNPVSGMLWGAVASIFIVLNATIALSGISAVRELASDKRALLQRQEGDRKAIESRLAELRSLAKDVATPAMIEAEMRTLKGWKWEKANQRLATAKDIAALQRRLDGWVASTEPAPASVDPAIDNLIALVVTIFNFRLDERFLGAVLSGAFALLLELGADLGPIAIGSLSRQVPRQVFSQPVVRQVEPVVALAEPQKNLSQPVATCRRPVAAIEFRDRFEDWFGRMVETGCDRFSTATDIMNEYNHWASKSGYPVVTLTRVGRYMTNLGLKKEPGGKKRYIGVAVRKLAVVR